MSNLAPSNTGIRPTIIKTIANRGSILETRNASRGIIRIIKRTGRTSSLRERERKEERIRGSGGGRLLLKPPR